MKSGLEDRNNGPSCTQSMKASTCLNEVRPGRPEQSGPLISHIGLSRVVSMKSGLEDRNNLDDLAYALKIVMSQ